MLSCSPPLSAKATPCVTESLLDVKPLSLPITLTKTERAEYETLKDAAFCLGPLRGMTFDEGYRKHVLMQFSLQGFEGYRFRRYCELRGRIPPNKSHVKLRMVRDYIKGYEGFFPFLLKPNQLLYRSYHHGESKDFLLGYVGPSGHLRVFAKNIIKFLITNHLNKGSYYDYLACLRGKQTVDTFSNLCGQKRDLARQSYYRLQMSLRNPKENLFEFLVKEDSRSLRDLWRVTVLICENTPQEAETYLYLAEYLQFNYEHIARTCAWVEARFPKEEADQTLLDPYLTASQTLSLHTIPDILLTQKKELIEIVTTPLENHPRDFASLIVTASIYKHLTGQKIETLIIYDSKKMVEIKYVYEPMNEVTEREILPEEKKGILEKKTPESLRKRVPLHDKFYPQLRC